MMKYRIKKWLSSNDFWMINEEDIEDDVDRMNYLVQIEEKAEREALGKKVFAEVCKDIWENEDIFECIFFHKKDIHQVTDEENNLFCILWDNDTKKIEIKVDALNCRLECKAVLAYLAKDEKEYVFEFANELNRFLRIGKTYVEKDILHYVSCLVYKNNVKKIDIYSYLKEVALICEMDMGREVERELPQFIERKVIRMISGADDVCSCKCFGEDGNRVFLSDVFIDYELPENPCVFKTLHGVYIRSQVEYTEYVEGLKERLQNSKDEQFLNAMKSGLDFAQTTFAPVEKRRGEEVYCQLPEALKEELEVEKGRIYAIVSEEDGILLFPNNMERLKQRYSFGRK